MLDPLVSIVIPTFNRPHFLRRALKSIVNQSYPNWECIVIDDNSNPACITYVSDFLNSDPRIFLFRNALSLHASRSRNLGVSKSSGSFICFLDDDDYWHPQKLELQLMHMIKTASSVSYCWSYLLDDNSCIVSSRHPNVEGRIFDLMLSNQPLCNCSTFMITRSAWNFSSGFNHLLKRGNDGAFIRELSEHFPITVVPQCLVYYQINTFGTNISTNNYLGLQRSIRSYKFRLSKYRQQLSLRPLKRAEILISVAHHYALLAKPIYSLKYLLAAFLLVSPLFYVRVRACFAILITLCLSPLSRLLKYTKS